MHAGHICGERDFIRRVRETPPGENDISTCPIRTATKLTQESNEIRANGCRGSTARRIEKLQSSVHALFFDVMTEKAVQRCSTS